MIAADHFSCSTTPNLARPAGPVSSAHQNERKARSEDRPAPSEDKAVARGAEGEAVAKRDAMLGDAKPGVAPKKGPVPPIILRPAGKSDAPEDLTRIGTQPFAARMAARASRANAATITDGEKTLPMILSPLSPQSLPSPQGRAGYADEAAL